METQLKISSVDTRRDMREFIYFPKSLYHGDANWIPPLWIDERKGYYRKNNPILAQSDFQLFLVKNSDGRVLARSIVYIDHTFNEFYRTRIGFFGSFECAENSEAAGKLIERMESWLKDRNMEALRGPINPVAECWGTLYEGFNSSPVFMSPYNRPYYNTLLEENGYIKVKDLLVYEGNMGNGYRIPERFLNFTDKLLASRPNLTVRSIDLKRLKRDAEYIWKLSNESLKNNWGFVPLDRKVLKDMLKKLRLIIDESAVWFVEDNGVPIAYCLGFPDLNIILKKTGGKIFPLGFLQILLKARKVKDFRLFGLAVDPKYHGIGLDVLLYVYLYKSLSHKNIRLEANYILEDNYNIKNALEKLDLTLIKKYRIYQKGLN